MGDESMAASLTADQKAKVDRAIAEWRSGIEGRVALITGGARGIGATVGRCFIEAGATVVAADKTWNGSDDFRTELENAGGMALEMDITDLDSIQAAHSQIVDRLGEVDILMNNAALVSETQHPPYGHRPTLETTEQDWRDMFEVNLFGTLKVAREFIEPMRRRGSGSIINVVSSGVVMLSQGGGFYGLRPNGREMPYQATKAALATLTFYLAEETWREGVAVNAFMPGHTRASWFDSTARAYTDSGRTYGSRPVIAEHLLPVTLFLAAQSGSGVTGRLYDVTEWNYDHGYGKYTTWHDRGLPDDVEAVYAEGESLVPGMGERSGVPTTPFLATAAATAALAKFRAEAAAAESAG